MLSRKSLCSDKLDNTYLFLHLIIAASNAAELSVLSI